MYSYLIIDLSVFAIPFFVSRFLKIKWQWKTALFAGFVSSLPLIVWDIYFTQSGIWGFTKNYLIGHEIFSLPIEELLFFVSIPFASLFIYENVKRNKVKMSKKTTNLLFVGVFFLSVSLILSLKSYSLVVGILSTFAAFYLHKEVKFKKLFLASFVFTVIPFVLVNSVLTYGLPWISPQPIVWYNESHYSNIRILSIPLEDFLYTFVMLYLNVKVYERLQTKSPLLIFESPQERKRVL